METQCHQCGYEWDYNGSKTSSATCPDCKRSTPLTDEQETTDPAESIDSDRDDDGGEQDTTTATNTASQQAPDSAEGSASQQEQVNTVQHPLTEQQASISAILEDMTEQFYDEINSIAGQAGEATDRVERVEQRLDDQRKMIIELTEAVEGLASIQHDIVNGEPTNGQTVTLLKDLRDNE